MQYPSGEVQASGHYRSQQTFVQQVALDLDFTMLIII
ncbi:hypothetical protein DFJ69_2235 [Thermomonospora umbrina]|uniref:Uncharacterized protein n=1 Tax=Thermomonospora umbrina TaxID=111806 RepID=A0A3D9SLI0_9ACTN|nr:hypothetical protein DFJ69_2235 [Thermomonospora umbrina]